MPTARRSRTIAAPAEELWELIGDPHHLPRWWPRVTRVEDVERRRVHRGDEDRARANSCAPTSTSSHCDEQSALLRWAQQVEGTPFARVLQLGRDRAAPRAASRAARTGRRRRRGRASALASARRGDDRAAPVRSRASSRASAAHGAPRRARDARRGARRPGADRWLSGARRRRRRCAGGAGAIRRTRRGCPRTRSSFLRETVGVADAAAPAGGARAGAPRAAGAVADDARQLRADRRRATACATTTPSASCTPPARAIPTSCACAPASPTGAPDAVRLPSDHEQLRAVLELCCAQLARGRAVRRRHERRRRRRAAARRARRRARARHEPHGRGARARPRVADGDRAGAACARPRSSATSRRAADARPLPAVLRVRLARRLRGDALRRDRPRPATARSSRWCSGCAWPRPPARSSWRRCPPAPPAPTCASCWSARRARSG